jgi:hypothetical protein
MDATAIIDIFIIVFLKTDKVLNNKESYTVLLLNGYIIGCMKK